MPGSGTPQPYPHQHQELPAPPPAPPPGNPRLVHYFLSEPEQLHGAGETTVLPGFVYQSRPKLYVGISITPVFPVFCSPRAFSRFRTPVSQILFLYTCSLCPPSPLMPSLPHESSLVTQELLSLCAPLPVPAASRSPPSLLPAPHTMCALLAFPVTVLFSILPLLS